MRRYYIYRQMLILKSVKSPKIPNHRPENTPYADNPQFMTIYIHQWSPYECIGGIDGIRGVRDLFFRCQYGWRRCPYDIQDSFQYNTGLIPLPYRDRRSRYVITDDSGNVRNISEFLPEIKESKFNNSPVQKHWGSNANEMRQTVTPQEIRELQEQYGIRVKPVKEKRRFIDYWSTCNWHRKGRSWKEQTKRKHQYHQNP